jgi:hypothetical protein
MAPIVLSLLLTAALLVVTMPDVLAGAFEPMPPEPAPRDEDHPALRNIRRHRALMAAREREATASASVDVWAAVEPPRGRAVLTVAPVRYA